MIKNPTHYLRLVVNEPAVRSDIDSLYADFCDLKDIWHRTRLEANRQRAMRAYNTWIIASFPKPQQLPLLLHSTSAWGFN